MNEDLKKVMEAKPEGMSIDYDRHSLTFVLPRYNSPLGFRRFNTTSQTLKLAGVTATFTFIGGVLYGIGHSYGVFILILTAASVALWFGLHFGLKLGTLKVRVAGKALTVWRSRTSFARPVVYHYKDYSQFYCLQSRDYFANMGIGASNDQEASFASVAYELTGLRNDGYVDLVATFALPEHAQFIERLVEVVAKIDNFEVPGEISRLTDTTRHLK